MRSLVHSRRRVVVGIVALVLVVFVGSAAAVTRQIAYGKPGVVQLVPVQGGFFTADSKTPSIVFPIHTIKRSPSAPRDAQKICTFFQISQAPTAPSTTWSVVYTSKQFCVWNKPGYWAQVGSHPWNQAKVGVKYHARFVVTWATKKKKKLARATYDYNTTVDYACKTTGCIVGTAADKTAYIQFHG